MRNSKKTTQSLYIRRTIGGGGAGKLLKINQPGSGRTTNEKAEGKGGKIEPSHYIWGKLQTPGEGPAVKTRCY